MKTEIDDIINSTMPTKEQVKEDILKAFENLLFFDIENQIHIINSIEFQKALDILGEIRDELYKIKPLN
jgi:hypothetical protein